MIVKQFVQAARAGIAHGPKIFFQVDNAFVSNPNFIAPNFARVIVGRCTVIKILLAS